MLGTTTQVLKITDMLFSQLSALNKICCQINLLMNGFYKPNSLYIRFVETIHQ